jgi:hypothetical protein
MPDSFTETTSQGFLSRIANSFIGLLLGPVFVIAAIALLWWNEGRAVQAIVGLSNAASATVEASASPSPGNEGKLVHVVGPATAQAAISDSDLNLSIPGQVAVARTVEMYQWREHEESHSQTNTGGSETTTKTYTYSQDWSSDPIDSSGFRHPDGHQNPSMPFQSTRYAASDAKLGSWTLDADTLGRVEPAQSLHPDAPDGWMRSGDYLLKGSSGTPKTGDLRVRYAGLASGGTLSVLGQQSHGGFASYATPNGYQVFLVALGNQPAAQMIATQRANEAMLTWILRGVGGVVMFIGFTMFLGPLSVMASFLPFLGSLVRGAAAALSLVISVPLTLIVIAMAWLAYRPILGGGLILAAIAAVYGLWRWHAGRKPAVPAKAVAPA